MRAAAIAFVTTAVAFGGQDPQRPTFRATSDVVAVSVSVRDRQRPVTKLVESDFEILDNGVAQHVVGVSYEKLPIDVTIVLDVSQSVTGGALDQLRRAIGQLRAGLTPGDRIKLVTFNMRVSRVTDFADSRVPIALTQVQASGSTAIFDAIATALVSAVDPDRRQLVLVFSDGNDSSSILDPGMTIDVARHTGGTVGVVLAATRSVSGTFALARETLGELAAQTGGRFLTLGPNADPGALLRVLLDEFRSSYVLHFVPRDVERSGYHTLQIKVSRGQYEVRARKGYAW